MNIRNIALAMMLTAATALPHPALAQDKPHHSDGMSDYLRFAPWVATYTLKAAGVESSSSWKRSMVNSALSMGLHEVVALDKRGSICRRHNRGCGPRVPQPSPLARRGSRCRHRLTEHRGRLLARRQDHRRAQPLARRHRRTNAVGGGGAVGLRHENKDAGCKYAPSVLYL